MNVQLIITRYCFDGRHESNEHHFAIHPNLFERPGIMMAGENIVLVFTALNFFTLSKKSDNPPLAKLLAVSLKILGYDLVYLSIEKSCSIFIFRLWFVSSPL